LEVSELPVADLVVGLFIVYGFVVLAVAFGFLHAFASRPVAPSVTAAAANSSELLSATGGSARQRF
jgi:hypothetical protein